MKMRDHFFDGETLESPCRECGQPYEMADERHDFGKLWRIENEQVLIRPYVKDDYDREATEGQ